MQGSPLVLRDIHQPAPPPWWPPAPGWWVLAAFVAVVLAVLLIRHRRRRQRRRRIAVAFDAAVDAGDTASARIAAMSELLRRAARRRDPQADKLQGEAWLAFLDGADPSRPFTAGPGRLLLEGGFRRDADPAHAAALQRLARERFLQWMAE